jgi:hypothetical protein
MVPDRCGEAWSENCQPRDQDRRHRWLGGGFDAILCHRICRIESLPIRKRLLRVDRHRHSPRHQTLTHLLFTAMDDPIIQRIERFRNCVGERRNRGHTLYSAQSGALVARLRSTGCNERFEILYWSLWKNRWVSTGPFGHTVLSIDDALRFIACEDIFMGYDVTAEWMRFAESRAKMSLELLLESQGCRGTSLMSVETPRDGPPPHRPDGPRSLLRCIHEFLSARNAIK